MENQKRFDLEQSLAQWRSTLENSPAIRASDMEELEAHLRDSIQTLQAKGLGVEEAFLIACRRLGPSRQLDREYCPEFQVKNTHYISFHTPEAFGQWS
jgi:hypothetical protein